MVLKHRVSQLMQRKQSLKPAHNSSTFLNNVVREMTTQGILTCPFKAAKLSKSEGWGNPKEGASDEGIIVMFQKRGGDELILHIVESTLPEPKHNNVSIRNILTSLAS